MGRNEIVKDRTSEGLKMQLRQRSAIQFGLDELGPSRVKVRIRTMQ